VQCQGVQGKKADRKIVSPFEREKTAAHPQQDKMRGSGPRRKQAYNASSTKEREQENEGRRRTNSAVGLKKQTKEKS